MMPSGLGMVNVRTAALVIVLLVLSADARRPIGAALPSALAATATTARVHDVPVVLQTGDNDCGLAVLSMLAAHMGRRLSAAPTGITRNLSLADLRSLASQSGIRLAGVHANPDEVHWDSLPFPFIAHWRLSTDHYVLAERIADGRMTIVDPAIGRLVLSERAFRSRWTGFALIPLN